MLSTKATGTEFTTGAPGKVFYERRREGQAADGHDQPVTIPNWPLRSGHSPGAACMVLFRLSSQGGLLQKLRDNESFLRPAGKIPNRNLRESMN
jgi:hypothetical protein